MNSLIDDVEVKRLREAIPIDDDEKALPELERRHFYRRCPEPPELEGMRAERGTAVSEAM